MRIILVVFLLGGLYAMYVSAKEPEAIKGAEILAPFKQDLKQALQQGLSENPERAIEICQIKAPTIADRLSRDGIKLGRTSKQLRNQKNVAPAWVAPLLEAYTKNTADRAPKVLSLPNGKSGYVEPITIAPLCLTCHGKTLAPEVSKTLAERYPNDQAIGYELGELRGLFWVEYPN